MLRDGGLSYRAALVLSMALLVAATGTALGLITWQGAKSSTASLAESLFRAASNGAAAKTQAFLLRAMPIARTLGNLAPLGLAVDEPDMLSHQLAVVLQQQEGVSWISFSNEKGEFIGAYRAPDGHLRINQSHLAANHTELIEYDVQSDGSWKIYRQDHDSGYDPRKRPFYQKAREEHRVVWIKPYVFYNQGVSGVTCANPIYEANGDLKGVLTVDFDLNSLSQFVQEQSTLVSRNARLFIMTADGVLVAHPSWQPRVQGGQRDQGSMLTETEIDDPVMKAFMGQLSPGDRSASGNTADGRQFEITQNGVPYYARTTVFAINGELVWIVGVMAPQDDFLAVVNRTNRMVLFACGCALLLAVILATMIARRLSGRVLELILFMNNVGRGDLSARAELGRSREFRQLSSAINRMIGDLRDRLRMRSALGVAMEVQQKLLPSAPPKIQGLDIAGCSVYCDETGGDYFDYVPLDPTRILIAIGDVSGHGIGSALLMASARAALRSRVASCDDIGELLTHVNGQLTEDIRASRFMTMQIWVIDSRRDMALWASAGHDPAFIYDPRTGQFSENGHGDVPLGIEPDVAYAQNTFGPLRPGHIVLLGTDGIWETTNPSGEFFGKDRVRDSIRAAANGTAAEICAAISKDLTNFRGGRRQQDDLTIVLVKILGNENRWVTKVEE